MVGDAPDPIATRKSTAKSGVLSANGRPCAPGGARGLSQFRWLSPQPGRNSMTPLDGQASVTRPVRVLPVDHVDPGDQPLVAPEIEGNRPGAGADVLVEVVNLGLAVAEGHPHIVEEDRPMRDLEPKRTE